MIECGLKGETSPALECRQLKSEVQKLRPEISSLNHQIQDLEVEKLAVRNKKTQSFMVGGAGLDDRSARASTMDGPSGADVLKRMLRR